MKVKDALRIRISPEHEQSLKTLAKVNRRSVVGEANVGIGAHIAKNKKIIKSSQL